ncbi:T9SS type A sorting domain-containing protein [Calditrichota bacterium]
MNKFVSICFFTIISVICNVAGISAQEYVDFFQTFEHSDKQYFYDIYATGGGGYVMCGYTISDDVYQGYIVLTDENGEAEWEFVLNNVVLFRSIVELDNGDFAVCGGGGGVGRVIRISSDGDLIWNNVYDHGAGYAIIELKNNDLAIAGGVGRSGFLMRIAADDGELVWTHEFDDYYLTQFYDLREIDGSLLVGGRSYDYDPLHNAQGSFIVGRFDQEDGEVEWHRLYHFSNYDSGIALTSHPNGYLLTGHYDWDSWPYKTLTLMIDGDGDQEWHTIRDDDDLSFHFEDICTLNNGSIIQVGSGGVPDQQGSFPIWNILDENGDEILFTVHEPEDFGDYSVNTYFYGVTSTQDGGAIACGSIYGADSVRYAMIVKLKPFLFDLTFTRHAPEDTSLFVLQDDTLRFAAHAEDMFGEAESYLWLRNFTDTLSTDTTVLVEFPELGVDTISCTAVREDQSVTMRWLVSVREMYIESYTPDTLDLQLRRGTAVDFSINVRAAHPEAVDYQWTLADLYGESVVLSDSAAASYTFNFSKSYTLEAWCRYDETFDDVVWNITAGSSIRGYAPEEFALTLVEGDSALFEVIPFDYESDSLTCNWYLNGEFVQDSLFTLNWIFADSGNFEVQVTLADSSDVDSIIWQVRVDPYNSIGPMRSAPTEFRLFAATPNPFNATTTISYSLPTPGVMSLTIFDMQGRELQRLAGGFKSAGSYATVWDAGAYPSGLYYARLEAGEAVRTVPMVLSK